MNNGYVIQWKSKVNGRAGRGTKLFEKEEAERLANELNAEYPEIEHEVIVVEQPREAPVEQSQSSAAPLFSAPLLV